MSWLYSGFPRWRRVRCLGKRGDTIPAYSVAEEFPANSREIMKVHHHLGIDGDCALTMGHFGKGDATVAAINNHGEHCRVGVNSAIMPVVVGRLDDSETLLSLLRFFAQSLHEADDVSDAVKALVEGFDLALQEK